MMDSTAHIPKLELKTEIVLLLKWKAQAAFKEYGSHTLL